MQQSEQDRILAAAVIELFDAVLRPGNPTGLGTNSTFLSFAYKVRNAYPTPDLLRERARQ
jgi:hypothetical protein